MAELDRLIGLVNSAVRKLEEEVKALQSGNKIKDQFSATLCEKVSRL